MTTLDVRMAQIRAWSATLLRRDEALEMVRSALGTIPGLDVEVVRYDDSGEPEAVLSDRAEPGELLRLSDAERAGYSAAAEGRTVEDRRRGGLVTYAPVYGATGRVVGAIRWVRLGA